MIRAFDAMLISKAEQFCHWWQRLTGLTNFWWARMGSLLFVLQFPWLMLMMLARYPADKYALQYAGLYALYCLMNLWQHRQRSREYREMEEYYLFRAHGVAHPSSLIWRVLWGSRLLSVSWSTGLTVMIAVMVSLMPLPVWHLVLPILMGTWAWSAQCYFETVIPLPAGTSKVRQLLDSWSVFWKQPVLAHQEE